MVCIRLEHAGEATVRRRIHESHPVAGSLRGKVSAVFRLDALNESPLRYRIGLAANEPPTAGHGPGRVHERAQQQHGQRGHSGGECASECLGQRLRLDRHGVFDRHPNLKVCYVETGVAWLYPLWERMAHVYNMAPQLFTRHPHDVIREHVWFHPHFEENPKRLIDLVGVDHVIFGSDWPHPEGLVRPADWVECLEGLSEEDKDKIMRTNMMKLLDLVPETEAKRANA